MRPSEEGASKRAQGNPALGPGVGNQLRLGWQSLKLASCTIHSDPGQWHLLWTGAWLLSCGSSSELALLLHSRGPPLYEAGGPYPQRALALPL